MERKIGEIFEHNGDWCQVVECFEDNYPCIGCCGCKGIGGARINGGECNGNARNDGKFVIFKKLEKVGEPYELYGHLIQKYRFFHSPAIQVNGICISKTINTDNIIKIEIKQTKENMEEYRMHDAKEDIPEFDKVVDECLFGEDKLNLKPFDLEAAKAGKTVCTRDGRKARIICFDKKNDYYPIIALVETEGKECIFQYTSNGEYLEGNENNSHSNLMMLPEKRVGWINVKKDASLFKSREEAERNCTKDYASVRVEFEI